MSEPRPLRERKRHRTRGQIVNAAFELFAERGFHAVTVDDIAARAEVGRTTFFRYFGDKQEVVFADADLIEPLLTDVPDLHGAGLSAVLDELRVVVIGLWEATARDADDFAAYVAVIDATPELQDRERRKLGHYVAAMQATLVDRGVEAPVAALGAQVALACFLTARTLAGPDLDSLLNAANGAFDALRAAAAPRRRR